MKFNKSYQATGSEQAPAAIMKSTIIKDPYMQIRLKKLVDADEPMQLRLVVRGARDGFDPKTIIGKCKDKGSTLTIFRSEGHGRVFGCYTNIPWKNDT